MMKMIRLAIVAFSGLALAACSLEAGDNTPTPVWARGPLVEAQGRAFLEVAPNRARFSVTFEEKRPSSEEASKIVVEKARAASEAIRKASDNRVRLTANLSVRPYYRQVTQKIGEFQETLVENIHPDALLGYVAEVSVSAVVLDPAKTDAARGAALAAGPRNAQPVYFFLEPTAEDQRAAFAAAAEDARARAEAAAKALGGRLGRLQVMQEGSGPCLGSPSTEPGRDEYESSVSRARAFPAPAAPPAPPAGFGAKVDAIVAAAENFRLAADPDPSRVTAEVCAVYAVR